MLLTHTANDLFPTLTASGQSSWKETLAVGLGKKQAICRGRVPACMSSCSLSLGSLARLSCGVEHLCACRRVCVCVHVCVR